MRVARIGLSYLPLAAADSDGHPFRGRRGGSRDRFFGERKGENDASRYARQRVTRFTTHCVLNCGAHRELYLQFFCISAILVL